MNVMISTLGWEDPLEEEMTPLSSILAWKIPWAEEPGRLHGVAMSQTRLSDQAHTHTHTHTHTYTHTLESSCEDVRKTLNSAKHPVGIRKVGAVVTTLFLTCPSPHCDLPQVLQKQSTVTYSLWTPR